MKIMNIKKTISFVFIAISVFIADSITAQKDNGKKNNPFAAEQKFTAGNFEGALDDYISLLENDPKNDNYNYNIAICYLNTNINKDKAIPYLEIITRKP